MGNTPIMGNKFTNNSELINSNSKRIMALFEELKTDLMSKFKEEDKGTLQKIETISFYGDFREILIVDGLDKKTEINLLVNNFEKLYTLTDKQKQIINTIILACPNVTE